MSCLKMSLQMSFKYRGCVWRNWRFISLQVEEIGDQEGEIGRVLEQNVSELRYFRVLGEFDERGCMEEKFIRG